MTKFLEAKTQKENYRALVDYHYLSWQKKESILFQGIRKVQVATFKDLARLNWEELAFLLAITDRTLHLWRDEHKLADCYADRFLQYVAVFSLLYNAIPGYELGNFWIRTPLHELAGRKPLEVLESHPGVLAVESLLKRKLAERWRNDMVCRASYQFTIRTTNNL